MGTTPDGVERVRALALALVTHAETIQKIKRLAMPRHQRLTTTDLHSRLCAIHTLCAGLEDELRKGHDASKTPDE